MNISEMEQMVQWLEYAQKEIATHPEDAAKKVGVVVNALKANIEKQRLTISGWAATQAVVEVTCPHCLVKPGEPCRTPTGRKAACTHGQRETYYRDQIGQEEFDLRHKVGTGETEA